MEQIRPGIEGPNGPGVLKQYEREHPNIRAALAYALESGDAELGNRIIASVGKFWVVHSHAREARRWIEQVLALPGEVTRHIGWKFSTLLVQWHKDDGDLDLASTGESKAWRWLVR